MDWEYPKSLDEIDNELEDQIKKEIQNERDPRIKQLLEKIESSRDHYEIIALSSELIGIDPENFMGHLRKAVSYHRLKQDQKAEQSFKESNKKSKECTYCMGCICDILTQFKKILRNL